MFGLVLGQVSMWLIAAVGLIAVWAWFLLRGREDYEVPVGFSVAILLIVGLTFSLGLRFGTEVTDFCVNNGHVQSATYEEGYTREYTTTESYTDSKGKSHSKLVKKREYVPPRWSAATSIGGWGISKDVYYGYKNRFTNETRTGSRHYDQVSWGDGRTYQTTWDGKADKLIPISDTQSTINWVKGSKFTIMKQRAGLDAKVPDYPALVDTPRGGKQYRVTNEGVVLPAGWKDAMEWNLDVLADEVGASKQCNPMIYLTQGGPDRAEAVRAKWVGGKKNDVIVVLGVSQWPKVDWATCISWSKNEMLPAATRDMFMDSSLDDGINVTNKFRDTIRKFYVRRSMKEFEYLKNEVDVPAWIYWVSVLFTAGAVVASGLVVNGRRW